MHPSSVRLPVGQKRCRRGTGGEEAAAHLLQETNNDISFIIHHSRNQVSVLFNYSTFTRCVGVIWPGPEMGAVLNLKAMGGNP